MGRKYMKYLSKIIALFLSVCLAAAAAGCAGRPAASSAAPVSVPSSAGESSAPAEKALLKIAALKGPTGIGMLKLMRDNDAGAAANRYRFTIAAAPDEIVSKITTGEVDAAAVPTNLAATLYNKTGGKIQVAAVNTLGVLFLLTNGETVTGVKGLKGKTVYASGQGATPEYAIDYILKQNGLTPGKDVTVKYVAEHAELAASLISGKTKIAVLPEPFVTQVKTKNQKITAALDLTKEWDKAAQGKSVLSMGALIVRRDFAEQNKAAFDSFLKEYQKSAGYANAEIKETAQLSEKYGIMPAAVAQKAIPNCNIVYIAGAEMKEKIPDFLKVLFQSNPKSVGGKLPGEDFYYAG